MILENASPLINLALVLALFFVGWSVLKALLKLTVRLFSIGCVALFGLAALVWLLGWIG